MHSTKDMKSIFKTAFFNAFVTTLYVCGIATFLYYGGNAKIGHAHTVIVPIFMLMLLVFSAALTGALMIGKPVLWYLEGKKKEGLVLLAYTLGTFFIFLLIMLAILILGFNRT